MRLYDYYFRELCVLVAMLLVVITFWSCGPSVRDSDVYSAEIEFVEAASEEQVERGIALIKATCRCESMMGQRGFTTVECRELAQTILVVQHRMNYHTAFMRYLGGISEDRPPKEPPEIPETFTLCPEELVSIDGVEDIYGDVDGGVAEGE